MSKVGQRILTSLREAVTMAELQAEITRLRADLAAERDRNGIITQAAQEVTNALRAENEKLREALLDTTASLVASVSLLERGGKKAAPSDKMFAQVLVDYKNSIDSARTALEGVTEKSGAVNE